MVLMIRSSNQDQIELYQLKKSFTVDFTVFDSNNAIFKLSNKLFIYILFFNYILEPSVLIIPELDMELSA